MEARRIGRARKHAEWQTVAAVALFHQPKIIWIPCLQNTREIDPIREQFTTELPRYAGAPKAHSVLALSIPKQGGQPLSHGGTGGTLCCDWPQ